MKKIISFFVAVAIVYEILTPIKLFYDGGRALMMLVPSLLILCYDRLFACRSFIPLSLYVIMGILLIIMGSEYISYPSLMTAIFAYVCYEHYIRTRDSFFAKTISLSLYIALMIMVLISIPLFITIPNLSRQLSEAEEGTLSTIMFWTLSYPTIHALPIYSIPLFYFFRNTQTKIWQFFSLIFIVAIFVVMFFADSTGALIVNIIVFSVLSIYNYNKNISTNIFRFFLLALVMMLILNKKIIVGILMAVQPIFTGSSTYQKIDEIILMVLGQGTSGDIESREERIDISMDSFLSNPLLPEFDTNKIGGHNFLLDQIVAMGLIPSVTFIWFLIERIKRPLKYMSPKETPYYFVAILSMLIMGLMKNFFLLFPTCCVVPLILMAENNKKYNDN